MIDAQTYTDLYKSNLGLLTMAMRELRRDHPRRAAQYLRRYATVERTRRTEKHSDARADYERTLYRREQAIKQQLQAAIEQYCQPAQCACVHPDARMCYEIRYNRDPEDWNIFDEPCQCGCHYEYEDEEEYSA